MKEEIKSKKNELPTVVGFIIIYIIVMVPLPKSDYELEKINWVTWLMLFILTIINCKWVINIAKRLKRNTRFWCVFAFITPPIALIILGLLDEKKPAEPEHPVSTLTKNQTKIGNLYLEEDETQD